jgi:imidazolonepropionase-like amidohydrolase
MTFQKTDKSIDPGETRKLKPGFFHVAVVFALTIFFLNSSPVAKEKVIAVRAGKIQTVAQGEIENGVILIKNDSIAEIGAQVAIPPDAEVLDFQGKYIMPGIVSPDSNLGIYKKKKLEIDSFFRLPDPAGKNLAFYPVLYSIDPDHPDYSLALKNGFTTFAISPPPAGISGLGAVFRPEGENFKEMVVKDRAFLKSSVYVNTPFWNMLKSSLEEAQRLLDEQKKKAEEKPKPNEGKSKDVTKDKAKAEAQKEEPTISESAKVFMDVIEGKTPLLAECAGPDAVSHLLELLAGYPKVRLIIKGGTEVYKAGPLLKEKNIPLILEPGIDVRSGFFQPNPERTNYVLKCQALDLKLAFQAPGNIEEQVHLLDCLNELSQYGLKRDVLLKGVTLVPAQLLGIDSLVGSLEKGKKADMIVLKNDPFDNVPIIEKVILGGKIVQ